MNDGRVWILSSSAWAMCKLIAAAALEVLSHKGGAESTIIGSAGARQESVPGFPAGHWAGLARQCFWRGLKGVPSWPGYVAKAQEW